MEVKQEISEQTCGVEIDNNGVDDVRLENFKSEIKEESNLESTDYPLECLDLKEFPIKTKIEKDGNEVTCFEEKQNTTQSFTLNENKMKIMETFSEHSSHKEPHMSPHAEGKTVNEIVKVQTTHGSYNCEICLKQFSVKSNLKAHLVVHTRERPHKCKICFKQFSQAGTLKIHLRGHTGEKPHKCKICFKQFGRAASRFKKKKTTHLTRTEYRPRRLENKTGGLSLEKLENLRG
uniref:Zinc finger protein 845-like n=1 Tax=Diabrotica virgifera virgifera TaxID=50390 RepID=A0A6P7GWU7_DIAVI